VGLARRQRARPARRRGRARRRRDRRPRRLGRQRVHARHPVRQPADHGFQSIHGLQRATTGTSFGNEFRDRDGAFVDVDYAANAASLGCAATVVRDVDGLRAALASAREEPRPSLVACHVEPLRALPGTGAFWDLGVPKASEDEQVRRLAREHLERARLQRSYL
jgi:3D-(3,5/4)-trihydroxycyclohexane-1,2-dione acylhydrolase (decyclizing)